MLLFRYNQGILARLLNNSKRTENGCLLWMGQRDNNGYGKTSYKGKKVKVSRLIMHLKKGFDLNSKFFILHKLECESRACFETNHLYIGTQYDNMQDVVEKGNHSNIHTGKTHCDNGHEYSNENILKIGGTRHCRECNRIRQRQYKQRIRKQLKLERIGVSNEKK